MIEIQFKYEFNKFGNGHKLTTCIDKSTSIDPHTQGTTNMWMNVFTNWDDCNIFEMIPKLIGIAY
jgi:hypothetical protein